jgi:hypothetical protein
LRQISVSHMGILNSQKVPTFHIKNIWNFLRFGPVIWSTKLI